MIYDTISILFNYDNKDKNRHLKIKISIVLFIIWMIITCISFIVIISLIILYELL